MKLTIDTNRLSGIQVSLTAEEVVAQLRRLMHAEDLHTIDGCVYRGENFLSNEAEDVETIRAIETVEAWLGRQYPRQC